MMKYGKYTEILWYSLPLESAWELIVLDGAYGTSSYFGNSNKTYAA